MRHAAGRRAGRRAERRILAGITALALVLGLMAAAPVAAATPGDELSDPIVVPTDQLGTPQSYDTTGATENPATDPTSCETEFGPVDGPFTETVWHAFTPDESGELIVDVNSFPDPEAPGFEAIVFVVADDGAGGVIDVGCGAFPASVRFAAEAGQTYYAMTGSLPGSEGGGPALITILKSFLSGLTVDPVAAYDPQEDTVTLSGTVTCAGADFLDLFVEGRQQVGAHTVLGEGFATYAPCDGDVAWSVTLVGRTTFFNPGSLDVAVNVTACAAFCVGDFVETSVKAQPTSNEPAPPPPPPPANDEREGAFSIELGGTATQDVSSATSAATDPGECPDQPITEFSGHTVWYAFIAPSDGWVEVNTIGSDYDTSAFVLDGDEIVRCNDDIVPGVDIQSQVTFLATEGTTYDVMVGSWQDSPPGTLVLNVLEGVEPPPPAEGPPNDEREDAIPLAIGETLTADTTGATSNFATDPFRCPIGFTPPSDHTVWYTITPETAQWVRVTTEGSEAAGTLYVWDGDTIIACSSVFTDEVPNVLFFGEAGTTYHVMVGAFTGAEGGLVVISAFEAPEPLTVTLTVDPVGTVDTRSGEVTITGTVTCNREASGGISVNASQTNGRFTAEGGGFADAECGPEPVAWSLSFTGDTAKFGSGDATVFADAFVFAEEEDASTFVEGQVRLVPIGRLRP